MNRSILLHGVCLLAISFSVSQACQAQNILVNVSDDNRTLTIAAEHTTGNRWSSLRTSLDIIPGVDVILLKGGNTLLNGQQQNLELDATTITRVEVQSVNFLRVFTYPEPLLADLVISGIGATEVEIAGGNIPYTGFKGEIVGNLEFTDGLGSAILSIDNVDIFGDVRISTGRGPEGVFFSCGYLGGSTTGSQGPVEIFGNLSINTGQDDDLLQFSAGYLRSGVYVNGNVDIQMGQGRDFISYENELTTSIDSEVSISLGQQ